MMSGSFLIYTSTSFYQLIIACTLIGIGLSLANCVSYYILDVYFKQHFEFVISVLLVIRGIGAIISTPVTQIVVMLYGWKSAFLINAGLSYQIFVCGSVFRTPKKTNRNKDNNLNIYKLCHFSLFKNKMFQTLLVVSCVQAASEGIILTMTDDLEERGASLYLSQSIGIIYGIGSLLGRPFHYVFNKCFTTDLLIHLAMCFLIATFSTFISCVFTSVASVFLYIFMYSFFTRWIESVKPLFMKYEIDADEFAYGYAWTYVFYGLGSCIIIPVTGLLRDSTGSYWASEVLFFVLSGIGLGIVLNVIYHRRIHYKLLQ
ncbi:monocarboxylate transporter 12-B-like [Antedon mediterranea]|uniref:monocarboxylate transporter 12-B-like n=1 Tax=Antedon mediterranea TaxID=105859 RepID=UPI003AF4AA54